eukprot:c25728_g1_i1 orf=168-821(+)
MAWRGDEWIGLGDEMWVHVVEMGVGNGRLNCRDVCSLSMVCRRLHHLSGLDCIWRKLSERDFVQADESLKECLGSASSGFTKGKYRSRFEKVKAVKLATQKRLVLRLQSCRAVLEQECKSLEDCICRERENLLNVLSRFKNTEKARHASVALQLWQPQVVRTMHEQVVEQQPVDLDACRQLLKMEAKVCREQITRSERSIVSNTISISTLISLQYGF